MMRLLVNKQFLKIVAMVVLIVGIGWITLNQVIRADETGICADEGTSASTCETQVALNSATDNPLPGGDTTSPTDSATDNPTVTPTPGLGQTSNPQSSAAASLAPGSSSTPTPRSSGTTTSGSPSVTTSATPSSGSGTNSGTISTGTTSQKTGTVSPSPYIPEQVVLKWDNPPVEYKVALTHFGDNIPAKYVKKALDLSPNNHNQVIINPPSPLTGLFGLLKSIFDR